MTSYSLLSFPLDPISFLCNPRVSECRESNSPQPCANHFPSFVFPLSLALMCGCQHIASGALDIIEERWWIKKRGGKTWETWSDSTDRWLRTPRTMHKLQNRIALLLLFLCTASAVVNESPMTLPPLCPHLFAQRARLHTSYMTYRDPHAQRHILMCLCRTSMQTIWDKDEVTKFDQSIFCGRCKILPRHKNKHYFFDSIMFKHNFPLFS